jgi:hypothetical protein
MRSNAQFNKGADNSTSRIAQQIAMPTPKQADQTKGIAIKSKNHLPIWSQAHTMRAFYCKPNS